MVSRSETVSKIQKSPDVSVLIIGGGVNGAGLFRELALQQINVLLVERADYSGATSAASTRIIHGGLRYLENGELRLVRESLHERNRLLRNAAHYVRPLPITIPIYTWWSGLPHAIKTVLGLKSKPQDRGALVVKIGLTLYDLLSGRGGPLPSHRFNLRRDALARRPALNKRIVCTATYYDAQVTYPERLCLELIRDGERAPTALALNYCNVVGLQGEMVTLRDELTGNQIPVKPLIVVNASGAWIDQTNDALHNQTRLIGGTKGSHLVVDHPELWRATAGQMLYFANADGRICIFYPFFDKVIIGATDIPLSDPDSAVCDGAETDYLLDSIRQVFPDIIVERSHIVFTFSGVRPLPQSDAATPGQISRDHSAPRIAPSKDRPFPIYALVGGKWTTFRAFAEQVTARVLSELQQSRRVNTADLPIGGGKSYPTNTEDRAALIKGWAERFALSNDRSGTLLDRYGTYGETVAAFIAQGADQPLTHCPDYSVREIQHLINTEAVHHLDDLILRRTLIGLLGQVNAALIDELTALAAPILGWTPEQSAAEGKRMAALLVERHGVPAPMDVPEFNSSTGPR